MFFYLIKSARITNFLLLLLSLNSFGQEETIDSLKQLLKNSTLKNNTEVYSDLAIMLQDKGDYKESYKYLYEGLHYSIKTNNIKAQPDFYRKIAYNFFLRSQLDSAIQNLKYSTDLYKKLDSYSPEIIVNNIQLAEYYSYNDNVILAFDILEQIKDSIPEKYSRRYWNTKAGICLKTEDYDQAKAYFLKAISTKYKNTRQLIVSYNNLAATYYSIGEIKNALLFFNKAKNLVKNDQLKTLSLNINIASSYMDIKQYDSARIELNRGRPLFKTSQSESAKALYAASCSELFLKTSKNIDSIPIYLIPAIRKLKKLNIKNYEMELNYVLAKYYSLKREHTNFENTINKVIESSKEDSLLLRLKDSYKLYVRHSKEIKNYATALKYSDSLSIIDSIMFKKSQLKNIEKIKLQIGIADLKKNYQNKIKDNILLEQKLSNRNITFILIGFIVILIAYLIYSKFKKDIGEKREIIKSEKKVTEIKSKKILDLSHYLKEREDFLDFFLNRIKQMRQMNEQDVIAEINSIISIISGLKVQNNHFEKFFFEYDNVQHELYEKLSLEYPELSEREKVILIYIKAGYSSSQLASKLNLTTQSVNNRRAMIRKKMKIDSKANLKTSLDKL